MVRLALKGFECQAEMITRKRIHAILANDEEDDKATIWYNRVMVVLIVCSIVPLWFKGSNIAFDVLELVCIAVFSFDYLMRWLTADISLNRGKASFVIYPFTPMAIVDLLSILPAFIALNPSFKTLRVLRILRALRAFKLVRYSKGVQAILSAIRNQRQQLMVVLVLAVAYVVICATVMFNVEPETFGIFYDALYWSVVSLTTVGYGDLYPTTEIGRFIAMASSFMGIAIIALPSGIITAGLVEELNGEA